jgi:flavin-dependent dehydrogenase
MGVDFDVIIVGSGPAGVSAAYPLVQSGIKVLMVDGGERGQI